YVTPWDFRFLYAISVWRLWYRDVFNFRIYVFKLQRYTYSINSRLGYYFWFLIFKQTDSISLKLLYLLNLCAYYWLCSRIALCCFPWFAKRCRYMGRSEERRVGMGRRWRWLEET